jgi:hypothetical protein
LTCTENRTQIRGKEHKLINTNLELQKHDKMTHCEIGGCDKSFPIDAVGQIRFLGPKINLQIIVWGSNGGEDKAKTG